MTLPNNHAISDVGHTADHNAIATQVNTNTTDIAARITTAAANAAYAPPRGNRTVFLGDSITKRGDTVTARSVSFPTYAGLVSGQKIWEVANAGVAGNTMDDMHARFATDVAALNPSVVVICAGSNDITIEGDNLAELIVDMKVLIADVQGIQASPVLCTIPPRTGQNTGVTAYNLWLRRYAAQHGIPLVDFYALLTDPTTGNYLAAYDAGDGIHPSNLGSAAMGALLSQKLVGSVVPAWEPALPASNIEPTNLLSNALFLNGGNAPTGWTHGSPGGTSLAVVTGDGTIKGNWARVTAAAATTGNDLLYQSVSATPGHTYSLVGRVSTSGLAAGAITAQVLMQFNDAGAGTLLQVYPIQAIDQDVSNGVFYIEATAPALTASVIVSLQTQIIGGTPSGYAQWAQIAAYDLTTLGVL